MSLKRRMVKAHSDKQLQGNHRTSPNGVRVITIRRFLQIRRRTDHFSCESYRFIYAIGNPIIFWGNTTASVRDCDVGFCDTANTGRTQKDVRSARAAVLKSQLCSWTTHVNGVSASRSATLSYFFWQHMGWGGVGWGCVHVPSTCTRWCTHGVVWGGAVFMFLQLAHAGDAHAMNATVLMGWCGVVKIWYVCSLLCVCWEYFKHKSWQMAAHSWIELFVCGTCGKRPVSFVLPDIVVASHRSLWWYLLFLRLSQHLISGPRFLNQLTTG